MILLYHQCVTKLNILNALQLSDCRTCFPIKINFSFKFDMKKSNMNFIERLFNEKYQEKING